MNDSQSSQIDNSLERRWASRLAGDIATWRSDRPGHLAHHLLADIGAGEPYLVLAHRPFPAAQPYAEQGPIFLHADACPRHAESEHTPRTFLPRGWIQQRLRLFPRTGSRTTLRSIAATQSGFISQASSLHPSVPEAEFGIAASP